MDINFSEYEIRPSKHFLLGKMRQWNWSADDVRDALEKAYKTEKVGKSKYEAYITKGTRGRKVIFVVNDELKKIFIITGAEGTGRL